MLAVPRIAPILPPTHSVILTSSVSSANSGGKVANPGQTVNDGNVSSSVEIEASINANNAGGSETTTVETNTNGVIQSKTTTAPIVPNEPVMVRVIASSNSNASNTTVTATTSVNNTISTSTVHLSFTPRVAQSFTRTIASFFRDIFSFHWF